MRVKRTSCFVLGRLYSGEGKTYVLLCVLGRLYSGEGKTYVLLCVLGGSTLVRVKRTSCFVF